MPPESLRSLVRGMQSYQLQHEVATHNLANQNTPAVQSYRAVVQSMDGRPEVTTILNQQQGPIEATSRPLDVALNGPGYLVVETVEGERLIRGGSLEVSSTGLLVGPTGHPVLGEDGPILVGDESVEVRGRSVLVGGEITDELRTVVSPDGVTPLGAGLSTPNGMLAEAEPEVITGAVEMPNHDSLDALMELMESQRMFQGMSSALMGVDQTIETMVNRVGSLR